MKLSAYTSNSIRFTDVKDFSLMQTFECGQCFRWNRTGANTYTGIAFNNPLIIRQLDKEDIELFCTLDDFNSIWKDYFDFNADYSAYKSNVQGDKFLERAVEYGWGIRLLNQEPWETLISFIISQQNNIPKIKSTIEKLCRLSGDNIAYMGETLYTFPTPSRILLTGEEGLRGIGLGYRAPYLISAAKTYINQMENLTDLASPKTRYEIAMYKLMKLNGVGPKVANCTALFDLRHKEAFPIDVWIKRVIDQVYNGVFDTSKYEGYAGIIQQYIFYYIRALNKKG